jgi:hypothetical protein
MIYVVAFVSFFAVGLIAGMIAHRIFVADQARQSPAGNHLLDCMGRCGETYAFASPEFDRCVAECFAAKRKGGTS